MTGDRISSLLGLAFALSLSMSGELHAQWWHIRAGAGIGNYSGDIQRIPRSIQPSAGVDVLYWWRPWTYLVVGTAFYSWKAEDQAGTWSRMRNLPFSGYGMGLRTGILVTFFHFNPDEWYRFRQWSSPYLEAGIYGFVYSVWRELHGERYILRQYGTEGQLSPRKQYPDPYNPVQGAFYLGFGYWYRFTENLSIMISLTHFWVWSDYLDDVHGRYPDPGIFLRNSEKEEIALELSFSSRLPEAYQVWGRQRGFRNTLDRFFALRIWLVYTFWSPQCPWPFPLPES